MKDQARNQLIALGAAALVILLAVGAIALGRSQNRADGTGGGAPLGPQMAGFISGGGGTVTVAGTATVSGTVSGVVADGSANAGAKPVAVAGVDSGGLVQTLQVDASGALSATVSGVVADGSANAGAKPVAVAGVDAGGLVQTLLVGSDGGITGTVDLGVTKLPLTGTISVNNAASGPLRIADSTGANIIIKALTVGNSLLATLARRTGLPADGATAPDLLTSDSDTTTGLHIPAILMGYNGTGVDRVRTAAGTTGILSVSNEGTKLTYSGVVSNVAPVAAATDWFTMTGSATKTVRVVRVTVSGIGTSSSIVNVIRRSTVDSGGTLGGTVSPAKHDSTSAASTVAAIGWYSANPVLGTDAGTLDSILVPHLTQTSGPSVVTRVYGGSNEQAIVLRGVAQMLAINFSGGSPTSATATVTWTEE